MAPELFDMELRAIRRDRAAHRGPELFLYERAFADCLDRLGLIGRRFGSALLIGCPDPGWPTRLRDFADRVAVLDPGARFARAADGARVEDASVCAAEGYGLCLALGTLDTVNDLPMALSRIRAALEPGGFFLGAIGGGDTLPELRSAMRVADQVDGAAVPHVHPRIEPATLAALMTAAGFVDPVVDIDRVRASYDTLSRLVGDLRSMAATNILAARSRRPISRQAWQAAARAFAAAGEAGRTVETFEILHFAGWTPH